MHMLMLTHYALGSTISFSRMISKYIVKKKKIGIRDKKYNFTKENNFFLLRCPLLIVALVFLK